MEIIRENVNKEVDRQVELEEITKPKEEENDFEFLANSSIQSEKTTEERLEETYQYFLLDICRLLSIRDCLASLEQFTRKEHFSLQQ